VINSKSKSKYAINLKVQIHLLIKGSINCNLVLPLTSDAFQIFPIRRGAQKLWEI